MGSLTNEQMAARRRPAFQRRGQKVIFKRYVSSTTNYTTGEVSVVFSEILIENALLWDIDTVTIIQSNGRYKVGDRAARIMKEELKSIAPLTRDRLRISSVDWTIIDTPTTGDEQVYVLVLRKP